MSMYNGGSRQLQGQFDSYRIADRLEQRTVHQMFTDDDRALIERSPMFFLATADAEGRLDCSYKGGMPDIQTHNSPAWIVWQCIGTVGLRVIIVWLYNNTGKSVFVAIFYHTMINVSEFLFPNYGSHYDPAITGIIIIFTAAIVTFLWGAKTLARYKWGDEYHRN